MNKRKLSPYYLLAFLTIFYGCKSSDVPQPVSQETDTTSVVTELPDSAFEVGAEVRSYKEYRATPTLQHDLVHTRLEVSFDWQKQYLNGKALLELSPYFYPQSTLTLDAKGFELHQVQLVSGAAKTPLQYEYDGNKIEIELDREYNRNENYFVEVEYTAKPNERKTGGSAAITSDKGLYFINPLGQEEGKPRQIWTQGETEASSAWFPTIDVPNQRTTQEIYITVNNKYKTLSNGVLVSSSLQNDSLRTDYWKMDQSHAPYLFMMAVGEFSVTEDEWEGIPVDYYVEPEFGKYAKAIFGNTPEMLSFFSGKLGYKYPWNKYAQVVVRDYVSGAMENTTASVFMEALQIDDRELLDRHWDDIIAHELFHQWFGDLVTTESWSNLPLNESFATYSEYLWNEYKYGEDAAAQKLMEEAASYFGEAETKQVDMIRFYYDDKEDMFDNHSYAKGSRILHMLRSYVGDEAFFASLQHYLKKNEYQAVEIQNLRLAFEEVTGEDLSWFFDEWFLASGHPVLRVEDEYSNGKVTVKVWQEQNLLTTPLYKLPLYVDIYSGGDKQRFAIDITEQYQEFELEAAQDPDLVVFDGEEQLLAEISHEKSPEEYRFQYANASHYISRYMALEEILTAGTEDQENRKVLLAALNDPSSYTRRLALSAFDSYEGTDKPAIEREVAKLVSDEKSLVRADALNILSSINPDAYREQFRKGLEDPSYSVLAASIQGYGLSAAPDREEVFGKYAEMDNSDVNLALADYYILNKVADRYDWFKNKIKGKSGTDLYYFTNYFGQYAATQSAEVQKDATGILEDYARNHQAYYVRYSAFNALALLEDLPDQFKLLKSIADEEQDPRLQQAYSRFFQ